jgi:hypothetical protein
MTTNPPILRNSLLATPVAVLAGLVSSVPDAFAALVSTGVVLGNLWVLGVLGPRLVTSVAQGESTVLWVGALLAKIVVVIGVFVAMLQVLPPFGLAMGFLPMLVGTLVTGVQLARLEEA